MTIRWLPIALVLALALTAGACSSSTADGEAIGTDNGDGGGSGGGVVSADYCTADSQCVPAAARCCDCPTFAMVDDPDQDICAGVTCPMPGPSCSQNVHAACEQNQCVLACNISECDLSCADGFALDANGCATCTCAAVTDRSCSASTDCSEVAADCCGCKLGGSDTAVPTSEVASYEASLSCPTNPSCPGVSTCQTDLMPTCVQGACALQPALPADACGRPDLPACPTGMVCGLNSDPLASAQGVGACIPAM